MGKTKNIVHKKEKKNCALLFWDIPIELRTKFKVKCAEQNITMREAVINLISLYSNQND